ncbi:MAG: RNA pyrophosphohydrolase [Alphaproteobacteria bacterium]|jgi:putative (di)nucleoside polyphosphate hydrolase
MSDAVNRDALPYRPCAGIMLFNPDGRVFVARRIDMPSAAWQMPQGGIEEGEIPVTAAFRELKEEIGTNNAELLDEHEDWLNYDLPDELLGQIWGGNFRGQTQKWFAMRYLGDDADINIETEVPEFSEWQWADPATLPDLIVPFKRDLYAALVKRFGHWAEHIKNNA